MLNCCIAFASLLLPGEVHLRGYVGDRFNGCLVNHVVSTDAKYLSDQFARKTETRYWQTEFWGKWMHSAVPLCKYDESGTLSRKISESVSAVLGTQEQNGYIGNYPPERRASRGWDVWGNKYTLLGLLHAYDLTGDRMALERARKLADYLLATFGEGAGKKQIDESGNFIGLPSCSMLEPVVLLYRRTDDRRYLEFAEYIVRRMDVDRLKLISDALAGVPVSKRSPASAGAATYAIMKGLNPGLKAYEMMSCYQGLLEYYEVKGDERLLRAALNTAESIARDEVNICGGAASVEHWYNGAKNQDRPFCRLQETCITVTWMRLCAKLLQLTGDPVWADRIETTFYNAYLGSLRPDGSEFAGYTPLVGTRSRGRYHCRMCTNCCNANGPRGFVTFLGALLTGTEEGVSMNFYALGEASARMLTGQQVLFETFTHYPMLNEAEVFYRNPTPAEFTLRLRIPSWSSNTCARVNGKPLESVPRPGRYLEIHRCWNPGDCVSLAFDFAGRAHRLHDSIAFTRGPIVLARDLRLSKGRDTGAMVRASFDASKPVDIRSERSPFRDVRMAFSIELPKETHRENPENELPEQVVFCDFASAGNTWDDTSAYRVWLPCECMPGDVQ